MSIRAFVILLVAVPVGLAAQGVGDTRPGAADDTLRFRVDPIVVTATRGPREASRTAQPVSVVQRREIEEWAPNTVSDLLGMLPGLGAVGVGASQKRPEIRGQRGQRILLLEDGLRLNNSRRKEDFGGLPALVDVTGVERVEVLRGPASVLYGSDAIGGVINVITLVPGEQGVHGNGTLRYGGAENQRTGSARLLGRFGDLTVRAGGTVRATDTYRAPAGTFGAIGLADGARVSGTAADDRSLDLRVGYDPQSGGSAFVKVERYDSDGAGYGWVDPELYDPGTAEVRITFPYQDFTKVSAGYRVGGLEAPLADQLEVVAYGQDNERERRFGIGPFEIVRGATLEIDNLNTTDIRTYGGRAEARKLATAGVLFTYGLDVWRDHAVGTDVGTRTVEGLGPVPVETVDETPQLPEATYLGLGAFVQGEVEATDRFSVVGGVRWEHVRAETFATTGLEDQTPVAITDGTLVASLNALYRLTDGLAVLGSVGRAFRSPNLIERFYDGPTPEGSGYQVRNPDLGPETSLNLDLGWRYRSDRVALEAFGFRNRIFDGIRIEPLGYDVDGSAAHQNTNVDELLFRGVELSGDVEVGVGFSVGAGYTWMDADDVQDDANPVGDSFSSKLSGSLRYRFDDRLWAAGEVRHNGERKEADLGDDNPIGEALPAFTVADLRAGLTTWRSSGGVSHEVTLALTNVTDALYAEFPNAGFFRPEPGRSLTITTSVRF